MKSHKSSSTAQLVALGRALADAGLSHVPEFSDPTARAFLSERGARSFEQTVQARREGRRKFRVGMATVMADMMALRTVAIDDAVRRAIEAGARQLVILGAGFDGRAWRMGELAGTRVFEVDHPATQAEKRAKAAGLPASLQDVSFVPVNFEQGTLDAALEGAGHDRSVPTCWIWEEFVMYLTRDAMRATLGTVAARSAQGSTLIVNYHTMRRGWFMQVMFRLIGEPQISNWSPAEMAADLAAAGFAVQDDSGMMDWNARFAVGATHVDRGSYMRIAVARRR